MTQAGRSTLDGFLIALAALAIYQLLGQVTIYGDGFQFVVWVSGGQLVHPVHYLYLPLLHLVDGGCELVGLDFYPAARFVSAVGASLGVWFVHAGCRVAGLDRGRSALIAGFAAGAPCVLFFATVVEVHAVFFALVGVAFWAAAGLLREREPDGRGPWFRSVLFGAATGVSFMVHASGAALPLPIGLWLCAEAWRRGRAAQLWCIVRMAIPAALAHAAVVAAALLLVPKLTGVQGNNAVGFVEGFEWHGLDEVPRTIWYEWFWAFIPCSLMFVLGYWRREMRLHSAALTLTLIPYLVIAFKLVPLLNEHGAYLIPLIIPAAWITVHSVPRWLASLLVVASLGTAVGVVLDHERTESSRALAVSLAEASEGRPITLFASTPDEMQVCMSLLPNSRMVWLGTVLEFPEERLDDLDKAVELQFRRDREAGRAVLLPAFADQALVALGPQYPAAIRLKQFFDTRCTSRPIAVKGFFGRELSLDE